MPSPDNARQLVDCLQKIIEEVEAIDKKKAATAAQLSTQEIRALSAVGRERCCVMSRIAKAICLSLSSATGLIDRLVEKNLVKRDRSSQDRRVVEVELTDEGRQVHAVALQSRLEFARDLLTGLNSQEQEALLTLFGKISQRIKPEPR